MGYLSCNAESAIATCDSGNKKWAIREFGRDELAAATNGFSAESFLGKGSHGSVYKAVLDGGRLTAAAKIARTPSADAEVEVLSRLRHPRLVNLIGFCSEAQAQARPIIVVEYMPNGSLHDALHPGSGRVPGWARRVRFGLQVARAVEALHAAEPPVIHRDIKSSNVLIDGDGRARLGDFGLALRGRAEDVRARSTPPAGTLGYLDPAYLAPADLTAKSDVFSFGILLLELVSGREAIDVAHSPPGLLDWAGPIIRRREFSRICDPRIGPPPDPAVAAALASLAARCVRSSADKRPGMPDVVRCLAALRARAHAPPAWHDLRRRVSCSDSGDAAEPLLSSAAVEMRVGVVVEVDKEKASSNKVVISLDDKRDSEETTKIEKKKKKKKPLVSIPDNTN